MKMEEIPKPRRLAAPIAKVLVANAPMRGPGARAALAAAINEGVSTGPVTRCLDRDCIMTGRDEGCRALEWQMEVNTRKICSMIFIFRIEGGVPPDVARGLAVR